MNTPSFFRSAAFRAAVLCAVLTACGGGGGGAPAVLPVDPPTPPVVEPPASFAYLLHANKVEVCEVDSSGLLSNCADTGDLPEHEILSAIAVGGSHAYIANVGLDAPSTIIRCSIGENGALSGCADTGRPMELNRPNGLTIHGSTVYISHAGIARVRKCEIESDGSLVNCVGVAADFMDDVAASAQDVQIVGSTAFVLHNFESKVSTCRVAVADESFLDCDDTGIAELENPTGFTIGGSHMYITNGSLNNVVRCIVEADGSFNDCRDAGVGRLWAPTQVAVRGTSVYITDADNGLTRCTAAIDGLLTDCSRMFPDLSNLQSIAFN